jgi:rfaE bifunctional protein nucleotidyltransferase chain/domain/rfaE bifunctional protein kinase chain/domain
VKITVVGDTLLDVDVLGAAERLTPDAPVPVVDVQTTSQRAGGAGLVATMLALDGHDVELVTALSDDEAGGRLRACLAGVRLISAPSGTATPVKTRIRVGGQSVVRVDEGCAEAPAPSVSDAMVQAIRTADAILVADYGRGLTAHPAIRTALDERRTSVPLVWDPHPKGAQPVASATVVTPNVAEATRSASVTASGVAGAATAAERLTSTWGCRAIVVTLGEHGALLRSPETGSTPLVVPATSVSAGDPCGAGDRFSATVAVRLGSGSDLVHAVTEAVADAGAFLATGGVASLEAPRSPRLLSTRPDPMEVIAQTRKARGTVVATGGCFDLLHAGHVRTLTSARALGDCLVVCLNSDASVRRLKGDARPIIGHDERAELLLALECVDAVVVFDEDTPDAALRTLRPDVWVKGGDYDADALPEARTLAEWGAQAVTVPFLPGHSTTRLADALTAVG